MSECDEVVIRAAAPAAPVVGLTFVGTLQEAVTWYWLEAASVQIQVQCLQQGRSLLQHFVPCSVQPAPSSVPHKLPHMFYAQPSGCSSCHRISQP